MKSWNSSPGSTLMWSTRATSPFPLRLISHSNSKTPPMPMAKLKTQMSTGQSRSCVLSLSIRNEISWRERLLLQIAGIYRMLRHRGHSSSRRLKGIIMVSWRGISCSILKLGSGSYNIKRNNRVRGRQPKHLRCIL